MRLGLCTREALEEDAAQFEFVHPELCVADDHLTEVSPAGNTRALHALDVGEMDIDVIEVVIDVNTEIIMARSSEGASAMMAVYTRYTPSASSSSRRTSSR